jgi:hypothetical protein
MNTFLKIVVTLFLMISFYSFGYYNGQNSNKLTPHQTEAEFKKLPKKFQHLAMEAAVDLYRKIKESEKNEKIVE